MTSDSSRLVERSLIPSLHETVRGRAMHLVKGYEFSPGGSDWKRTPVEWPVRSL